MADRNNDIGGDLLPFDIVGWYESQAASALTACAGVSDDIYRVTGDDIYVKSRAPYLGALWWGGSTIATLKYLEFRQPSLKVPYRFYPAGDLNSSIAAKDFVNLMAYPLPLYPDEKLNAFVQQSTNETKMIVAYLTSGEAKMSDVQNVEPTHVITGEADQTLTAGSWTTVTITWDQDLPIGRYAVVGMKVGSYISASWQFGFARLRYLPEEKDPMWRPGVPVRYLQGDKLGMAAIQSNIEYWYVERWPLMPEVSFRHDQMPNIEILSPAALTDHVVNLLLQKIE